MRIQQIKEYKKEYMDLLLLADPQKDMVERYLKKGEMFALFDDDDKAQSVCVGVFLGDGECEIKNLATREESWGKGYASRLLQYVFEYYSMTCHTMYVGTGETEKNIGFYENRGFVYSHTDKNFFTRYYDGPVYDEGKLLTDMIYLKRELKEKVDPRKVVDVALEAGKILLKSGGEIFRVEETIQYICKRYWIENVDIFTLSHAIILSIVDDEGNSYTKVKHVPLSSNNIGIVTEVNDLSRRFSAGMLTIEEAFEQLKYIENMPSVKSGYIVLAAGIGSGCFGYLMGAGVYDSIAAFFIGCILYVWVLSAKKHTMSKIIINIVGGVIISILGLLIRLMFPGAVQLDGMIIGAIMPLVPGVGFVNSIRDLQGGDFLSGTVRMIDTLLVFAYIAIGVGFTLGAYTNIAGGL